MSFFNELCRRNVIRVAAVYVASSWLMFQIVDMVVENTNAPEWVMPVFIQAVLIGLPVVAIAAWLLELTPDGIRLVKNVNPANSISSKTGRQLTRGIIMILAMAIVLFLTDRFRHDAWFEPKASDTGIEQREGGEKEDCTSGNPMNPECGKPPAGENG